MSESSSKKTVESTIKAKKPIVKQKKQTDVEDFKSWLAGLSSAPKLHINGPEYISAVLTVDFGTPLEEKEKTNLTSEQNAELVSKMKLTTRGLFNKPDLNVRVQSDSNTGIWWTTVN
jgi:hypothetical protein